MQQHIQRFRGRPNITLYKFGTNHGALEVSSIFYRAMHFSALRTAQCTLVHCEVMHCALRGLGIACRPSVCPSVTLVDCDHIGWKSWKLMNTFIRQKAEETDRQTDRQTNKQTMPTQSNNTKELTKTTNKILLYSYIIVKRNADITDSIRSRVKN